RAQRGVTGAPCTCSHASLRRSDTPPIGKHVCVLLSCLHEESPMRPAHKLLKRFLRQRAWEIDWHETTTGKLRADLLLRPVYGAEDVPLYFASTNPLTWLAWAEGRLDAEEVTPSLSRSVCDALGLPAEERCYFMRHCREALARLCGRRAADKSILSTLGAIPHHERLSRPRAVRTALDCAE